MEQNSKDHNPEENPKDEHHQGETPEIKGAKTKARNRRLVVYEVASLLLLTFGGIAIFINHALALLSIVLLLGGAIFAALYLRLSLITHGEKGSRANGVFWCVLTACIVLSVIFTIGLFPKSSAPPKPNLIFGVATTHAPNAILLITNASLPLDEMNLALTPTSPVLAIATYSEEQTVGLQFELTDDPVSSVPVEGLVVTAMLFRKSAFELVPGWQEAFDINPGMKDTNRPRRFVRKFPDTLFGNDVAVFPLIKFSSTQPPEAGVFVPIGFMVTSKGAQLYHLAFWLLLVKMPPGDSTLVLPQVLLGGRGIGFTNDVFFTVPDTHSLSLQEYQGRDSKVNRPSISN